MMILTIELLINVVTELLVNLLRDTTCPTDDLVVNQLDLFVELFCFLTLSSKLGDLVVKVRELR